VLGHDPDQYDQGIMDISKCVWRLVLKWHSEETLEWDDTGMPLPESVTAWEYLIRKVYQLEGTSPEHVDDAQYEGPGLDDDEEGNEWKDA
jgi:hypothetical protein